MFIKSEEGRLRVFEFAKYPLVVAKLTAAGALDTSFGQSGLSRLDDLPSFVSVTASVTANVRANGTLDVSTSDIMTKSTGTNTDGVIYRVLANGSPDPTFNVVVDPLLYTDVQRIIATPLAPIQVGNWSLASSPAEQTLWSQTIRFTDPGLDTWTATIDFGDGNRMTYNFSNPAHVAETNFQRVAGTDQYQFTVSHTYADNGSYNLSVVIADTTDNLSTAETKTLIVNPASAVFINATASGTTEGAEWSGQVTLRDGNDTLRVEVDYGDGTPKTFVPLVARNEITGEVTYSLRHVYAADGNYNVTVTSYDDDDLDAQGNPRTSISVLNTQFSSTFLSRISNVLPSFQVQTPAEELLEGSAYTFAIVNLSEPGSDTLTYEWDFDYDGSNFTTDYSTTSQQVSHVFNDNRSSLPRPAQRGTNGVNVSSQGLVQVGSTIYFVSDHQGGDVELYRLTDAGNVELVSVANGTGIHPTGSATPQDLQEVDGVLYFTANNGTDGRQLWRVNVAGHAEMVERASGSGPANLTISFIAQAGGITYLAANDGVNGNELWRLNTAGQLEMISISGGSAGINPSGNASPYNIVNAGGATYFGADDGTGNRLFRIDSSGDAVRVLNGTGESLVAYDLTEFADTLYFTSWNSSHGAELYRIATGSGLAERVSDIASGPSNSQVGFLNVVGDSLFFRANDGVNGSGLYRANAAGQISLVRHFQSLTMDSFTVVGSQAYFIAFDSSSGDEIWRVTDQGAVSLVNRLGSTTGIAIGVGGSNPQDLTNAGGQLVFTANDGTSGQELWRVNTSGQAELISVEGSDRGIAAGSNSSNPKMMTRLGSLVYFVANAGSGDQLWLIGEGTTARLAAFAGVQAITNPAMLSVRDDVLAFTGVVGSGREIYRVVDPSDYQVSVRVSDGSRDAGGNLIYVTNTFNANVQNVAPAINTTLIPTTGSEGQPIVFDPSQFITDAAGDRLSFDWVIKDELGAVVLRADNPNFTFTPANDGIYTLEVTVVDDEPEQQRGSATATVTVNVANQAPSFEIASSHPEWIVAGATRTLEGTPLSFSVGALNEPGPNDLASLQYLWTVTTDDNLPVALSSNTGTSITFTPPDQGNYWVTLTVTDQIVALDAGQLVLRPGAVVSRQHLVVADNADPGLISVNVTTAGNAAGVVHNLPANVPVRITGAFADASRADVHTATISINPTIPIETIVLQPNVDDDGAFSFQYQFAGPTPQQVGQGITYIDYLVTFQVRDLDGGESLPVQRTIRVLATDEVAPTVTLGAAGLQNTAVPQLSGQVNDLTSIVRVMVNDQSYTAQVDAIGNWTLPDAPTLASDATRYWFPLLTQLAT